MNSKKNYLIVLLCAILSILLATKNTLALDIERPEYNVIIEDDINLITPEQKEKILASMKPIVEKGNVVLKIYEGKTEYKEAEAVFDDYFNQKWQKTNTLAVGISIPNKKDISEEDDITHYYNIFIIKNGDSFGNLTEKILKEQIWLSTPQIRSNNIVEEIPKIFENLNNPSNILNQEESNEIGEEKETINQTINNYQVVIEDDANLLTTTEQEQLKDKMMSLTKYGNIIFKSINSNSTTTSAYAKEYYHSKFKQESGTLFLIDMYNRQIYIFSDGNNYSIITNGKAEIITDNIYQYATNKNYYDCAYNAFDQIETLLEGGKILEPMRIISNIVVSLVSAFFITFLFVLSQSKIKKASDKDVLSKCDIDFMIKDIYGKKTGTRREYSPVSDSSSSGGGSSGGGGFSGGGGSSGGGGGHSF